MSGQNLNIAVASADARGLDGQVSPHFGRCPAYTLVEVVNGGILDTRIEPNPFADGHAPGQIPDFIAGLGAQVILTGGIGVRAIQHFREQNVEVAAGFSGKVREAVLAYLSGEVREADPCRGGHGDCHEHD